MFTRDGMIWVILLCPTVLIFPFKQTASSLFAVLTAPDKFPIMHHREKLKEQSNAKCPKKMNNKGEQKDCL